MERRTFVKNVSLGSLGLGFTFNTLFSSCNSSNLKEDEFHQFVSELLQDWCDGMIRIQIIDPSQPEIHGALACPACNKIHGRCMDAVYPFMYMADVSGEKKYLDAAILVMEWADNVSNEDGSWTVIPNPKSWKGITVFGAIALAEALHFHGHLLDESRRERWTGRLGKAADYVYRNFDLTFTNINYGATAIYALNLFGRVLNNPGYTKRSHELAGGIKEFFTPKNHLLFGEGKPSTKKSAKGLVAVDLGYNVEETLNSLVMYAVHENDEELLTLLSKSLASHLEFMLPDGAWDNSWGTRQFKWSYWGSRTTDGSQPAFAFMAHKNPAFGTAVVRNTELLQRCTADGLLHGGPHYVSHGIKPCVHHTFAHAKPLATLLNMADELPVINANTPLPRLSADGIKSFPEIDTWLVARGPWRGTVSTYDAIYYKGHYRQATGGSMSVLYHTKVGILMAASMAKYVLAEKNNQQPNPGPDFAFTPRIEVHSNDDWFTNLYDLDAKAKLTDTNGKIKVDVTAQLYNESLLKVEGTCGDFLLEYTLDEENVKFTAQNQPGSSIKFPTALVLPILSPTGEELKQESPTKITIKKPEGLVVIESNTPLEIIKSERDRVFNMVPGAEAVPIKAYFSSSDPQAIVVTIRIV